MSQYLDCETAKKNTFFELALAFCHHHRHRQKDKKEHKIQKSGISLNSRNKNKG